MSSFEILSILCGSSAEEDDFEEDDLIPYLRARAGRLRNPLLAEEADEEGGSGGTDIAAGGDVKEEGFMNHWIGNHQDEMLESYGAIEGAAVGGAGEEEFPPGGTDLSDDKAHTLIIFDWDDTILPTTIIRDRTRASILNSRAMLPKWQGYLSNEISELDKTMGQEFEALAQVAQQTLSLASQCGVVCMITNGSSDWIRTSCLRYMPSLWPSLEPIRRISAKDLFQMHSRDPLQWKKCTFSTELNLHFKRNAMVASTTASSTNNNLPQMPKIVISVGDSLHERHALYHFYDTTTLDNVAIRSIKLVPLPDVKSLEAQHAALALHLPAIAAISHKCRCVDLRYNFLAKYRDSWGVEEHEDHDESTRRPREDDEIDGEDDDDDDVVNPVALSTEPGQSIDQMLWRALCCASQTPPTPSEDRALLTPSTVDRDDDHDEDEKALVVTPKPGIVEEIPNTVTSFLGRALSLTRMFRGTPGGGFLKDGVCVSECHTGDGSGASSLEAESAFGFTPLHKSTGEKATVKLNGGNPYLVAHVCGFTFDPDFEPYESC